MIQPVWPDSGRRPVARPRVRVEHANLGATLLGLGVQFQDMIGRKRAADGLSNPQILTCRDPTDAQAELFGSLLNPGKLILAGDFITHLHQAQSTIFNDQTVMIILVPAFEIMFAILTGDFL